MTAGHACLLARGCEPLAPGQSSLLSDTSAGGCSHSPCGINSALAAAHLTFRPSRPLARYSPAVKPTLIAEKWSERVLGEFFEQVSGVRYAAVHLGVMFWIGLSTRWP